LWRSRRVCGTTGSLSLYHLTEKEALLREAYLDFCEEHDFPLIALAKGAVIVSAKNRGLPFLEEAFLDRRTLPNGQLIPREEPNAVITKLDEIITAIPSIQADTACIHSDSLNGLEIARAARLAIHQK